MRPSRHSLLGLLVSGVLDHGIVIGVALLVDLLGVGQDVAAVLLVYSFFASLLVKISIPAEPNSAPPANRPIFAQFITHFPFTILIRYTVWILQINPEGLLIILQRLPI